MPISMRFLLPLAAATWCDWLAIAAVLLVSCAAAGVLAAWCYHCGRVGRSPVPDVPAMPWAKQQEAEPPPPRAQPRVGIPSRARGDS